LNEENGIARFPLGEDHSILWILQYCSSQPALGEESFRIKYPSFARRHKTILGGNMGFAGRRRRFAGQRHPSLQFLTDAERLARKRTFSEKISLTYYAGVSVLGSILGRYTRT
jgi:hypothetical protein